MNDNTSMQFQEEVWRATEPNGGTAHNCVWKTYQKEHPGWHDADCSWYIYGHEYGEQHALCQIKKVK